MNYQILPMGNAWKNGMFSVPSLVANEYIKLASEYQLKALLLILSNGGLANSKEIAKTLGCTESDVDDFLEFWVDEGILVIDGAAPVEAKTQAPAPKKEARPEKTKSKKELESIPVPTLTQKDITAALNQNPELDNLIQGAQEVFGRTLSHIEQELVINMVQYYGLPSEVVLTILQYCKAQKDKHIAIGNAYLGAMAKNWSEEGITTLDAAEEKLLELENSDKYWKEVLSVASISYRNPTVNQREMIKNWNEGFSFDMIEYACEQMKENAVKPTLKYVDKILKNWQKKGIKTLDEAKADNEAHKAKNEKAKSGKLQGTPSFDISEIEKKAMFDDNFDI
jgi:DnaD/phage-associated family protein